MVECEQRIASLGSEQRPFAEGNARAHGAAEELPFQRVLELGREAGPGLRTPVRAPGAIKPSAREITSDRGGYVLVLIEGGTFKMGSPSSEEGRWGDEGPQHAVTLDDFYLGKSPVTNEEYGRYLEANPAAAKPEYWEDQEYNQPSQPVVGVSWEEARAYCEWAGLVLPTEAQWEYACRGGTSTAYWSGGQEADLARVGWYSGNSELRLHVVGEKAANPFGLFDMHGNVWEWCADWYGGYDLPVDSGTALRRVESGSSRVFRGGGFGLGARSARSACRDRSVPSNRFTFLGFRPALARP